MIDYLSLRPMRITTATVVFGRHHFLYEDGVGKVLDGQRRVLLTAVGTVERTAEHQWTLSGEGLSWLVERSGGCNCSKPAITPRT